MVTNCGGPDAPQRFMPSVVRVARGVIAVGTPVSRRASGHRCGRRHSANAARGAPHPFRPGDSGATPLGALSDGPRPCPWRAVLRSLLAFCLIPIEPERALGLLNALSVHGTLSDGLLGVNRAAVHLRRGEISAARSELTDVLNGARDSEALLWPLNSLLDHQSTPDIWCTTTTHEWSQEVLLQLRTTLATPGSHGSAQ